jgi:hypothetical protein
MEQTAAKHPLDLAYLKQKIINQGGTPPSEVPHEENQEIIESSSGSDDDDHMVQYTDLVGKANDIDFDTWLETMRRRTS